MLKKVLIIKWIICCILFTSKVDSQTLILTPKALTEFESVYSNIVTGIKSEDKQAFVVKLEPQNINDTLKQYKNKYNRIIALGRTIIEATQALTPDQPWRAGVFRQPPALDENIQGISINIEPDIIPHEIHSLSSNIDTVYTVYHNANPEQIRVAVNAAKKLGISLVTYISDSPSDTAQIWFRILDQIKPNHDAIWITDNTHLNETKTFEFIITSAWKKKILLASSIPAHAPRGVALGVVPDFEQYGKSLAQSFDQDAINIRALERREIKTVANVRTLYHLGYRNLETAYEDYNVVLP